MRWSIFLIEYFFTKLSKLKHLIFMHSISLSETKNLLFRWFKMWDLLNEPIPLAQCFFNLPMEFLFIK